MNKLIKTSAEGAYTFGGSDYKIAILKKITSLFSF